MEEYALMKPTLCSRCKKNVAVVFITRLDNNGQGGHNEGLCLKCARELNIRPVADMIEKMGLSDEELEGLTNEMMSAFEGAESMEGLLGNLSSALGDAAKNDEDDDEGCCGSCSTLDDDDFFQIACPSCGADIVIDESVLDIGEVTCPNCGDKFSLDLTDEPLDEDEDKPEE